MQACRRGPVLIKTIAGVAIKGRRGPWVRGNSTISKGNVLAEEAPFCRTGGQEARVKDKADQIVSVRDVLRKRVASMALTALKAQSPIRAEGAHVEAEGSALDLSEQRAKFSKDRCKALPPPGCKS